MSTPQQDRVGLVRGHAWCGLIAGASGEPTVALGRSHFVIGTSRWRILGGRPSVAAPLPGVPGEAPGDGIGKKKIPGEVPCDRIE